MKILITGAKGQLGLTLQEVLKNHQLILTDVDDLDITNQSAVDDFVKQNKPDVIINAAAYTAVDIAEEEKDLAHKINAVGPENLARAAKQNNAVFFHISTDFVFDGRKTTPYIESDKPHPLGVYGQTKFDGEKTVEEIGGRYYILRTAWLYSPYGKNFVKTMIRLGQEKDELKVVADQIGCPTYAYDLASAIKKIIDDKFSADFGLYHFAGAGSCSWHAFATKIIELSGGHAKVSKTTAKEYGLPAERPAYSVLDCSKIEKVGVKTYPWQESLKQCVELISY